MTDQVGLHKIIRYINKYTPDYGKNSPARIALIAQPNGCRNPDQGHAELYHRQDKAHESQ